MKNRKILWPLLALCRAIGSFFLLGVIGLAITVIIVLAIQVIMGKKSRNQPWKIREILLHLLALCMVIGSLLLGGVSDAIIALPAALCAPGAAFWVGRLVVGEGSA